MGYPRDTQWENCGTPVGHLGHSGIPLGQMWDAQGSHLEHHWDTVGTQIVSFGHPLETLFGTAYFGTYWTPIEQPRWHPMGHPLCTHSSIVGTPYWDTIGTPYLGHIGHHPWNNHGGTQWDNTFVSTVALLGHPMGHPIGMAWVTPFGTHWVWDTLDTHHHWNNTHREQPIWDTL